MRSRCSPRDHAHAVRFLRQHQRGVFAELIRRVGPAGFCFGSDLPIVRMPPPDLRAGK